MHVCLLASKTYHYIICCRKLYTEFGSFKSQECVIVYLQIYDHASVYIFTLAFKVPRNSMKMSRKCMSGFCLIKD